MVFEPAVFDYLDGDDTVSRPTRSSSWRTRASSPRTGTRASGSAWTRSATSGYWRALWQSTGARPGRSGRERRSGRTGRRSSPARPASSAAGSCGACSTAGADVVCLVRDWVPQSELVRGGLLEQVTSCAATSATRRCWSGCSASTRSTPCSTWPPRRSSASPTATRSRRSRRNIARHLGAARSVPAQPAGQADRPRVVGQGLRRPARCCRTTRTRRCRGAIPTTSASPART